VGDDRTGEWRRLHNEELEIYGTEREMIEQENGEDYITRSLRYMELRGR